MEPREPIGGNLNEFARGAGGALLILPGAATGVHRRTIIEEASRNRLPAIYPPFEIADVKFAYILSA